MTLQVLAAIAWLIAGLVSAGFTVAFAQYEWPRSLAEKQYRQDLGFALFFGFAFGPIALVISFFMSGLGEHGWSLKRRAAR
jgi:hypothetical protein